MIEVNVDGFDPLDQELDILFCFDEEVCLDAARILFFGGLHDLLLDNLKFDLYQVEQGLYSLFIFSKRIILCILVAAFDIGLRKLLHQIVDHNLILYSLLVVVYLEEIVGDLLVNIYLFFEVITELDRSHLVLDRFFEVFKALQIRRDKFQGLQFYGVGYLRRPELLQNIGKLFVWLNVFFAILECLSNKENSLLHVWVENTILIYLQLKFQSQLRALNALLEILDDHVVFGQLFVRFSETELSIGNVLLNFNRFEHGLNRLFDVGLFSEEVGQMNIRFNQLDTLLHFWVGFQALNCLDQVILRVFKLFHTLIGKGQIIVKRRKLSGQEHLAIVHQFLRVIKLIRIIFNFGIFFFWVELLDFEILFDLEDALQQITGSLVFLFFSEINSNTLNNCGILFVHIWEGVWPLQRRLLLGDSLRKVATTIEAEIFKFVGNLLALYHLGIFLVEIGQTLFEQFSGFLFAIGFFEKISQIEDAFKSCEMFLAVDLLRHF